MAKRPPAEPDRPPPAHRPVRLSRRQLLRAGLGAGATLLLPALAACEQAQATPPAAAPLATAGASTPAPLAAAPTAAPASANVAPQPPVLRPIDGRLDLSYTLQAVEFPRVPTGADATAPMSLRTYVVSGPSAPAGPYASFPAPTIRLRRGDQIRLELQNRLLANQNPDQCEPVKGTPVPHSGGPHNCFHNLNTTNLHFHGTHAFPESPGDDVLLAIEPGQTMVYRFPINDHQAQGTHWYHPHNHGATAIQVQNGMAGALIVEGDFDDVPEIAGAVDLVFVLQQIRQDLNLTLATSLGAGTILINGQLSPTVTMRPGEVQRWRFVNATIQATGIVELTFSSAGGSSDIPAMYQIAMDGVPFTNEQWDPADPVDFFRLAAGNRADFLVQAPQTPGTYTLSHQVAAPRPGSGGGGGGGGGGGAGATPTPTSDFPTPGPNEQATLLTVEVVGDGSAGYVASLPQKGGFPPLPDFLQPITDDELLDPSGQKRTRNLSFSVTGNPGDPPMVLIDGRQFDPARVDQCMVINTAEEWTIYNTSGLVHPFHIHINPFMVTEIFDAVANQTTQPMRWQDTILLPAAMTDKSSGACTTPSYVRIRHRFIDFTGEYVLHCHILGHEDRGMMQLVEVVESEVMCPPGTRWQDKQAVPQCEVAGAPSPFLCGLAEEA